MYLKRARYDDNPWHDSCQTRVVGQGSGTSVPIELAQTYEDMGNELKLYLYERYLKGKLVAEEVTRIAYYHTHSGGVGLELLAMHPSRTTGHAEHVDGVMRQELDTPDLYPLPTPVFSKQSCHRVEVNIEINLPTLAISRTVLAESPDDDSMEDPGILQYGPSYCEHPVVRKAKASGVHWRRIRPLAIYTDGVQYNKKQTFIAMYIHDMRADKKHLCWIIRMLLSGCSSIA